MRQQQQAKEYLTGIVAYWNREASNLSSQERQLLIDYDMYCYENERATPRDFRAVHEFLTWLGRRPA